MVQWVVGSIPHGGPIVLFLVLQPVLHDWCNKGRDMCYPVCGMMHIKELSDSERKPPHGLLFLISRKGSFICTIP